MEGKKIINIEIDDSDTNDSNSENSNVESENNNGGGNSKKTVKEKISKALKELSMNNNMKFMGDFAPELSNREKRKLLRKFSDWKKVSSVYDENGLLCGSEKDVCDCLIEDCPGCHFPCPKCRSYKCGFDCRVNRKWTYDYVENEGQKSLRKNSLVGNNGNGHS